MVLIGDAFVNSRDQEEAKKPLELKKQLERKAMEPTSRMAMEEEAKGCNL